MSAQAAPVKTAPARWTREQMAQRVAQDIPNANVTVCWLRVPQETVQQRLTDREAGSARAFLLGVTGRIAEQIASLDLPGMVVDNGQRPLNEVAREILVRVNWPAPPV